MLEDLISWAEQYHYPQLVLSEKDVVRHGKRHWQHLFTDASERIERAMQRVQQWQRRLESEASHD